MCGFTGIIETRHQNRYDFEDILTSMGAALRHRGPDAGGNWVERQSGIGLAHRRLAIIDLSHAGSQPMPSACGRYTLAYNGEIYNFRSIRSSLEKKGTAFRGSSDSEVLVEAIATWGIQKALSKMNGMFAFALWDRQKKELTLARDRIGKKPLYYGWAGSAFIFGSELKALRRHPDFDGTLDRQALTLFLRYNYVPAPRSIHEQIRKLMPGSFLTLPHEVVSERPCIDTLRTRERAYWSVVETAKTARSAPFEGSDKCAAGELERRLLQATDLRMISDVPLGALLSGGIDSSLVVSLMQAQSASPVKTFSLGFQDREDNETPQAKKIAAHLGTDHNEIHVTGQDALNVVPMLPDLYDEPFADTSQIPTFLVSRLARQHVTVALSGDGGDELFCGYRRYMRAADIWSFNSKIPLALRKSVSSTIQAIPGLAARESKLAKWMRDLEAATPAATYLNRISKWRCPAAAVIRGSEPPPLFEELIREADIEDPHEAAMLIDQTSYLPDDILVKVDRASMAVSMELRNPLLDHRVIEFAWSLPLSMKINGKRSKHIMKQVLAQYIPEAYANAPKKGFGPPMRAWLSGPLREWAEDLLSEKKLRHEGIFEPAPIRNTWTRFLAGNRKLHPHLWNVLMFQAWHHQQ